MWSFRIRLSYACGMTPLTTARTPRADAERNRQRVLDAAATVFASRGSAATLNDVARHAGLGVGTVYRKFADKDALLDALVADKLRMMAVLAEEAAVVDNAGAAIRGLMLAVMTARATDRGLDAILGEPSRSARFAQGLAESFIPTVERMVAAAIEAGELRPGFAAQEVCLLGFMVGKVADVTRHSHADAWQRYAQLLVDGTRPTASGEPLQPAALGLDDLTAALGRAV
jgi:AcrR family transcriptional regulator